MKRRIFGVETEYGLMCASLNGGVPPLDPEDAAQRLFAQVLATNRSTNTFLANGARLYLDVGAHPEYASAECDSVHDIVCNDRAGDAIFSTMVDVLNEELIQKSIPGKVHLFKNNVDTQGNSFGCHENYLVRRRRDYRARIESLVPFFVSRQILVGAGFIAKDDAGVRYEISQRAHHMWDAVSSASTRARPMINTRDEPHGDAELYRRMHVIVGDSNISDSTSALKIGMTEAVLNCLEDGVRFRQCELADPMLAIREISQDTSGKALVEQANGTRITALEIQVAIYEQVMAHYESAGWLSTLDPTREYVFDLWKRALEGIERGNTDSLATEIDWIAKKRLLKRYQERLGVGLDDPRIARLDLAWHDITRSGLRASLEASGGLKKLVTEDEVTTAMAIPPQTTRAKLRGDFVAAALDSRRDFMADWTNLRLITADGSATVLLKDPFVNADSRVDALMEELDC
ncbi:Pup--protein ligase [Arcanobacterium bovis]|uniref:Pup--protein ligase n=1 Tax=Arcanobacterium bovis TaxID=2529275 RepID=A0A4Q9V1H8_9ACTO|nr:Pup--protein ligase [Arcanobacterium bovis]TBW22970.1 Pup--protein ligase [Arcanobacterium bovis]